MQHDLKTDPQYFDAVDDGSKTFELRRNDRDFKAGDDITLRETTIPAQDISKGYPWDYTGREIHLEVTYILQGGFDGALHEDWAILGFKRVN